MLSVMTVGRLEFYNFDHLASEFLDRIVSVVVSDASSVVSLKILSVAPCGDLDKGCGSRRVPHWEG